jgi:hypothetical protein
MGTIFPTALDNDVTLHQLVNNLASTLTGAYTAPATTLDLADGSAFPAGGDVIYVGGERGTYTGKSGNQLTGVAGITNNYAAGTTVEQLLDAVHHNDLRDAVKAIEAKVGIDGSAVTSSLDYKVAQKPGLSGSNPAALGSASPGVASDAARSDHVHPTTGLEMTANKATGFGTVNDTLYPSVQAVKTYVDNVAAGLDVRASCRAATTANIASMSGTMTIDGVSLAVGNRVLVKDQSTGSQNGIYVVQSGAWTRAPDADTSAEVTAGIFVWISEGTANGDTGWVLTTNDAIVLDTTALTFSQFTGVGQITVTAPLTKTAPNALAVSAASQTAAGVVELATSAEAQTGTDTVRAVHPAGLAAAAVYQGKHSFFLPAQALRPRSANGCATLATTNGASNQPDIHYLAFDGAAAEYAGASVQMPMDWNGGTITAKFCWRRASGTGAANVVWGIRGASVTDGEDPAVTFGTGATVTDDAKTTTANFALSAETSDCTIAGSPAGGHLVFLEVYRDGASGSDTLDAVDAWLSGVTVFYTTNVKNEA